MLILAHIIQRILAPSEQSRALSSNEFIVLDPGVGGIICPCNLFESIGTDIFIILLVLTLII
jgi:hypothetical protein